MQRTDTGYQAGCLRTLVGTRRLSLMLVARCEAVNNMTASAFVPRSESKVVFVVALACYAIAAETLLRTIAWAAGAPQAPIGTLTAHGYPGLQIASGLLFAPVIESLALIGLIEVLHRLALPPSVQVVSVAAVFALLHALQQGPAGLSVAPGWAIMAAAYIAWRGASWRVGLLLVASIHALLNAIPAIWTIGYAARNI